MNLNFFVTFGTIVTSNCIYFYMLCLFVYLIYISIFFFILHIHFYLFIIIL